MAYPTKMRFISLLGILAVVGAFFAPALPKSIHAQDPAPPKIESDDGRVAREGTWLTQATPAASGGGYLYNSGEAILSLNFVGASLEIIYVSGPSLGTLAIEVDGTVLRTVITTAESTAYGQVAKIDYLTDETHELKVYAQGRRTIAVDAFIVGTGGTASASALAEVTHPVESDTRFPLCDATPGLRRVNLVNGGLGQGNANAGLASFSGDGRYVIFGSEATNLVAGDTNGHNDIFLRDQQTCETRRVSVASDGTQGNADASYALVSGDGRYAFFESSATNLVPNETNGMSDIFVHDRLTSATALVSVATAGTQANQAAYLRDVSADGRFVLFMTNANNLDPADSTNLDYDFYLRDRQLNTTTRLTPERTTNIEGGQISDDGRYLVYTTIYVHPSNFYYCYSTACSEVYWYDRQTNTSVRVARSSAGDPPTGGRYGAGGAAISGDGRYVAFHSDRTNLDDGTAATRNCSFSYTVLLGTPIHITVYSPCGQIYVFDSVTQQNTRLTLVARRHQAQDPKISDDGRYVSYEVHELDEYHVTHAHDGYVLDRQTGIATLIGYGTGTNYFYKMAADGSFVSFQSESPDLVVGDTNGVSDVFVEPLGTGSGSVISADKLALFRNDTNSVSLIQTSQSTPPPAAYRSFTITPDPDGQNGRWVMGDWDGDGDKTPGTYANGAFFFTDDITPNPTWLSVWIGLIDRPPVAGRFEAGVNHDCVGAVDNANFPPYGTAFALYFTCDLTNGTAPALTFQWLSVLLPDSGGFSGAHQFTAGDFNNDGLDSIAVRRGEFIAFGNVPPTTLLSEFNLAQYWGTPATTGGDYGVFLAGDFDNAAGDSFGVHYQNGNFYYRNAVDWYPGPHNLQQVGQPIGTPVQATSWR